MKTRKTVCFVLIVTLILCCIPFAANASNDLYVNGDVCLDLDGLLLEYDNIYVSYGSLTIGGDGTLIVNGDIGGEGDVTIYGGTVVVSGLIGVGITGCIHIAGGDVTVGGLDWQYAKGYSGCIIDMGAKVLVTGDIYPSIDCQSNGLDIREGASVVVLGAVEHTSDFNMPYRACTNVQITNPNSSAMTVRVVEDGVTTCTFMLPTGADHFFFTPQSSNATVDLIFQWPNQIVTKHSIPSTGLFDSYSITL